MRKVTSLLSIVTLLITVVFSSCQPHGVDEAIELTLAEHNIVLSNAAQNAPDIMVTTNAPKFTVFTGAEWLEATASGNSIKIAVQANEGVALRKAQILVQAGTQSEVINVTQSAADAVLDININEKNMTNMGGTFLVALHSNLSGYKAKIEDGADWLSVTEFEDFLSVEVAPNKSYQTRSAKIFINSGTNSREIVVTQIGTGSKFPKPLLKRFITGHEVMSYEATQDHLYMLYMSGGRNGATFFPETYAFAINSNVFKESTYGIAHPYNQLDLVSYLVVQGQDILSSDEYRSFLEEMGFKLTAPDPMNYGNYSGSFEADGGRWTVDVVIREPKLTDRESVVEFKFEELQPKPQPTFSELPFDKGVEFIRHETMTAEDIMAYEIEQGNKIERKSYNQRYRTQLAQFYVEVNEKYSPLVTKVYNFDLGSEEQYPTGQVDNLLTVRTDWEKVFWINRKEDFLFTKEFEDLFLNKGGFSYYSTDDATGMKSYLNEKLNLLIGFQFGVDPRTQKESVAIYFFSYNGEGIVLPNAQERISNAVMNSSAYFKPYSSKKGQH